MAIPLVRGRFRALVVNNRLLGVLAISLYFARVLESHSTVWPYNSSIFQLSEAGGAASGKDFSKKASGSRVRDG